MAKFCRQCGVSLSEGAVFCPECGAGGFGTNSVEHLPALRRGCDTGQEILHEVRRSVDTAADGTGAEQPRAPPPFPQSYVQAQQVLSPRVLARSWAQRRAQSPAQWQTSGTELPQRPGKTLVVVNM
ncbi:hypothetical protein FACS1894171_1230 [Clostridia bacterium]|nr:hypothetical protein FACS1894171_1230 [Clostridia bacterium]